jgi:hypothetical protein
LLVGVNIGLMFMVWLLMFLKIVLLWRKTLRWMGKHSLFTLVYHAMHDCLIRSKSKLSPTKVATVLKVNLPESYSIQFYSAVADLPVYWDDLVPEDNILWKQRYLATIESNRVSNFDNYYGVVKIGAEPVGILFFQHRSYRIGDRTQNDTDQGFFAKLLRLSFVKDISLGMMFCGNMMLSGNYGFHFVKSLSQSATGLLLEACLDQMAAWLRAQGKKVQITIIKDMPKVEPIGLSDRYHWFQTLPDMFLTLPDHWRTEADYLNDLSSKYRNRVNRARTKLTPYVKRQMSQVDMELNQAVIYKLYKQVASDTDFNFIDLPPNYFELLLDALGDQFEMHGYFGPDGQLIGFFTLINNNAIEIDAHFVGFDAQVNADHQLYLNMLSDMRLVSMEKGMKLLYLARTATEIKSSIGAVHSDTLCYYKHSNSLLNLVLRQLVNRVHKVPEWTPRNPFK